MPVTALLLALAAAFLHAAGNVLLGRRADTESATAIVLAVGVVAFAPVAALTWRVEGAAVPWIAASAALELGYFLLLALAYRDSDVSLVYPIARGSAPVLVLVGGIAIAGRSTSAGQVAGVCLVAAGVLLVSGLRGGADRRGVVLALATAVCIAGYTLVDKEGIRHAAAVPYLELVLLPAAILYVPLAVARRGRAAVRAELRPSTIAVALALYATYLLVLAALRLASAASVSAVRETSVVIATGLAAVVARERVTGWRALGAALVAGGVALLALA
jgi:drug/metabolite transporter (DMT)-like permease